MPCAEERVFKFFGEELEQVYRYVLFWINTAGRAGCVLTLLLLIWGAFDDPERPLVFIFKRSVRDAQGAGVLESCSGSQRASPKEIEDARPSRD